MRYPLRVDSQIRSTLDVFVTIWAANPVEFPNCKSFRRHTSEAFPPGRTKINSTIPHKFSAACGTTVLTWSCAVQHVALLGRLGYLHLVLHATCKSCNLRNLDLIIVCGSNLPLRISFASEGRPWQSRSHMRYCMADLVDLSVIAVCSTLHFNRSTTTVANFWRIHPTIPMFRLCQTKARRSTLNKKLLGCFEQNLSSTRCSVTRQV